MGALAAKTMIIICGPTAVGKTDVAIALAEKFHCPILSADSRQCYRELRIGVARPSQAALDKVPHYFIASHSIREELTAAGFEKYALEKAHSLFRDHNPLLMVGGTGLYIRAFCEGLDEIPEIKAGIREGIMAQYASKGMDWLQEEIREKDPAFFAAGEIQNPQRMMRALEVLESTGQSILHFRKGQKALREFRIIKIGLELPREELVKRIDVRVDAMMEQGLLEEVKSLRPFQSLNALQTVGYAELFNYLEGRCSLEEAIAQIKVHTRQYAKRQMTWFRKDPSLHWFAPQDIAGIMTFLEGQLSGQTH